VTGEITHVVPDFTVLNGRRTFNMALQSMIPPADETVMDSRYRDQGPFIQPRKPTCRRQCVIHGNIVVALQNLQRVNRFLDNCEFPKDRNVGI